MFALSTNHNLAMHLASAGLYVFPCDQTKAPIIYQHMQIKWGMLATTNHADINAWWRANPDALVGIAIGKAGLVAIDLDAPTETKSCGITAFNKLVRDTGNIVPLCPVTITAGGGYHLFFRSPSVDIGNSRGGLPKGIDARGSRGYVIAPGSVKLDGLKYMADPNSPSLVQSFVTDSIPALPQWIVDLVTMRPPGGEHMGVIPMSTRKANARERAFAESALRNRCDALASLNSGRYHGLTDTGLMVGSMVSAGWLTREWAERKITEAMVANGYRKAWRPQMAWAIETGMQQPRAPMEVTHKPPIPGWPPVAA